MINTRMKDYDYYLVSEDNGYGQLTISKEIQGTVKLSISTITKAVLDDVRYSEANYLGLTYDKNINDTYVIKYGDELLKVQFVIPDGRYTQVFMGVYG
jgi:hypothetical protein